MDNMITKMTPVNLLEKYGEDSLKELSLLDMTKLPADICEWSNTCHTDMGIYGQEGPVELVDFMVSSMKEREKDT